MPMPTYRNTNYSLIYVLLAMVLICGLAIAGPLVIRPAMNNLSGSIALNKYKIAFQDIQHPAGTERLALRTSMGDFTGIDQGCDFFVGEVRRYNGREDAIIGAYADQAISGNPLQVMFIEGGLIRTQVSNFLPEQLDNLSAWGLPPGAEQQPLYMVYLVVLDYEGDLRLDCQ
jgi:hypothetical protein